MQNIGPKWQPIKVEIFICSYLCSYFHGICIRRVNDCLFIYRIYNVFLREIFTQPSVHYAIVFGSDGRFLSCEQTGRTE